VLALTENATEAISGILSAPNVPDEAGLRIAASPSNDAADPAAGVLTLTLTESPAENDQIIDQRGARVFVDEPIAGDLDDKALDAMVSEQQVTFSIAERTP
jgi:Fe-S cluster assembly iron-binding protein IscA